MAEQTESGSDNIVSNLSDKSRSLRKTSVKKRLETEMKKVTKKRKEKYPKKPRLNKYQRKVANAKERERMKRMNEVFERLKKHVPMEQLNSDDGKDKKVTILRSAIVYINSLKQLISDCDANLIDSELYSPSSVASPPSPPVQSPTSKSQKVQSSGGQNKVKNSKRVILESKWTNYSQQFLQDKFSKDIPDKSDPCSPLPPINAVQPSTDALLTQLALNPIQPGIHLKEPKVQNLPNIDELFGGQMMDTGSAGTNIQICIQLIEDPSKLDDIDMEQYTDIAHCLSL